MLYQPPLEGSGVVTTEIALTLCILAVAIALFVSERLPVDVVALLVLLSLVITGLLTPAEAFAGFASPAVVAVGAIFVVSAGLFQCGLAGWMATLMIRLAGRSGPRLIALLMIGVAVLSAVMNNVAAVAVLLPAVIGISRQTDISPSRLLLPLAYGAAMGGTLTLIGTPPNLIVSDVLRQRGLPPLGFFEITMLGLPLVLAGVAFMLTLGRQLLPDRPFRDKLRRARLPGELIDIYHLPERIHTLEVPVGSPLVGRTLQQSAMRQDFGLTVLGVVRPSEQVVDPEPSETIRASDRLLVEGGPRRLERAASRWELHASRARPDEAGLLLAGDTGLVEVTLAPRSSFEGHSLRDVDFREKYGVTVLALWRGGQPVEREIAAEPLQMGDVLLVQGSWSRIRVLRREPALIVLLGDESVPHRTQKAPYALAILLGMIAAVVFGVAPISVAALTAALLMVLSGCLRIEEAHQAIEWNVVFVVAGTLPLGVAMENSGATQWIAEVALSPVAGLGTLPLLILLFLMTALMNLAISNYATAALLAPIAFSLGVGAGLDPRPLVLAVALGSSVAFATPIAHQSNLLVMGPGDYRPSDYLRAGIPLTVVALVVMVATLLVMG
jgi:di/tricarboxylate transporter